jgi:hypothetical protein
MILQRIPWPLATLVFVAFFIITAVLHFWTYRFSPRLGEGNDDIPVPANAAISPNQLHPLIPVNGPPTSSLYG